MHILFITGEYPPVPGGVGAYTEALALALVGLDFDVSVVTTRRLAERGVAAPGVDARQISPNLPVHTTKAGHTVHVYPEIRRWSWSVCRRLAERARHLRADWMHVQYQTAAFSMNPSINVAPHWWRGRGFRNIAWTYHDLLVPYLFPKAGGWLRHQITQLPIASTKATIVTNPADEQTLRCRGYSPHQIPIGSNIQGYAPTAEERRQRRRVRGYGERDLVIGYFGFLNRSKGGVTLVRTLFRLQRERQRVYLLMIGERVGTSDPTNSAYLREVEKLINELELSDYVQWTGQQSDAEVGADLNACDVLLMPYEDGASLRRGTLMAGLANGCAIVTTEPKLPIPELKDGQHVLYIPPNDPDSAALMIKHLADNAVVAERLRQNARTVSQQFSWNNIAARHAEIYLTCTQE